MDERRWTPPPAAPRPVKAPQISDATGAPPPAARWFARFVLSMAFFGALSALFSSSFPISLGLFLFFTDDDFIEWACRAVGIQLVPDTFGAVFVKTLVFLIAVTVVLACWQDSLPAWLPGGPPPGAARWAFVGGGALFIAALSSASAALMRIVLPEIRRPSQAWTLTRAVIALLIFGMLYFVVQAFGPQERRASDASPLAPSTHLAAL